MLDEEKGSAMNPKKTRHTSSGMGRAGLATLLCVAGLGLSGCGSDSGNGGMPPLSDAGSNTGDSRPSVPVDIVATAQAAGSFSTLVAALTAAELADVLKGPGPFTVFAPTDAAFAKLPAGTVESLLKPENKAQLQAVLKYHVVAGKVLAADVVKLTSASTLEGSAVKVSVVGAGVKLNDSNVTQVDVMASNGVIHVIDAVLLPPS